jgi:hypothetical protein
VGASVTSTRWLSPLLPDIEGRGEPRIPLLLLVKLGGAVKAAQPTPKKFMSALSWMLQASHASRPQQDWDGQCRLSPRPMTFMVCLCLVTYNS